MIWRYWPVAKLQHEIGKKVLEQIGQILPLVDKEGERIFFETDKNSLVRLMMAFSEEKYFTNANNVSKCLNYLPAEKFLALQKHLDHHPEGNVESEIKTLAKVVAKNENKRSEFLRFFELPKRFFPQPHETKPGLFVITAPSFENPVEINSAYKVLKDFQYDIFFRAIAKLVPAMSRMIVQMPTGSGKTRTVMEIIANHFNTDDESKKRVVWLANSEELCEQAVSCFVEVWQHVGKKDVEVQRVWGGNTSPQESQYSRDMQFIVGSLQSLWKLIEVMDNDSKTVFSLTSLLVIDEAHIAVARTYSNVVRKIAQLSHCRVVGLTATPGRAIEEETTDLSELFHGEIVSLKDPSGNQANAISYLRSIKVLSFVEYAPLVVDTKVSLSKTEAKKLETDLEFSGAILKRIGQSNLRSAEIVARLKPVLEKESKVLLFAPSIENSKFLTSLFIFLGYRAAHIDGSTHSSTRSQLIEEYIKGELQILCNYGVLTTGFDAPKTDVLCIARPTKSPVLYSQMIGRGLRAPAVGGTAECLIIEVRDNFLWQGTQDQLYDHFSSYWEAS